MAGTIHPARSMFLRVAIGTAQADDLSYELTTSVGSLPMIRSTKTGKIWLIGWEELIGLAIDAGIDKESEADHAA